MNSLDLSFNKIINIDTGVFAPLFRLYWLNLAHNTELVFGAGGAMFKNIEETLLHLNLDNVSLTEVSFIVLNALDFLNLLKNSSSSNDSQFDYKYQLPVMTNRWHDKHATVFSNALLSDVAVRNSLTFFSVLRHFQNPVFTYY